MSLFTRSLNLIKGRISLLKKTNSVAQKRKEQALDREMAEVHPVSSKKIDPSPISDDSLEAPLDPKKRTI